MKQFQGFPARMQFTSIPNLFFSTLLPQIGDISELKTILHIFETLYRKRGYPRFVTYRELLGNKSLMTSLQQTAKSAEEVLRQALETATQRGVILHMTLAGDDGVEDIYLLNTDSQREVAAKIENGEIKEPLNETMFGVNLLDLFKNIEAVSKEFKAYGSYRAPYVKIKEVQIIGSAVPANKE